MKICLTSQAPFIGGAEVAMERLALGLHEAGHNVFLVLGTREAVMERMQQTGLRCIHSPMPFTDKWHWWSYHKARNALRKLIKRERPDVVHNNDLPTHQIISDAASGLGIPRICHHRFPFNGICLDWLNKFGAERHLFVSNALMVELTAVSEKLRRSSRSVVYDGLALPSVPSQEHRLRLRKKLRLPGDRAIVLFTGQIIERKGVADLLMAWSRLKAIWGERTALVIVGDDVQGGGQYRVKMQELDRELGCRASFVGFQKNVGEWLAAADVAVVPSHVEPLGNATLEAMSYALPVIGCAVGGIPEMIIDEQTGMLVPPRSPDQLGDAIGRLLADRETRVWFGIQGRKRCEELFSLQSHVQAVLREYKAVQGTYSVLQNPRATSLR